MGARLSRSSWIAVALVLLLPIPRTIAQVLSPGQVVPLAVRQGRCDFVLPTPEVGDKYYLILGALARPAGPYSVRVQTEVTKDPVSLTPENALEDSAWRQGVGELASRLARARQNHTPAADYPPRVDPPGQKVFYIFIKEHDFQNPDNYAAVTGRLCAVGRHCQVYVDRDVADPEALQPTVKDVIRTFDQEIYPEARRTLGQALDVDRDGRFTILFSNWLGRLAGGKVSLDGFVRGSDFYQDLPAPYGNRCDMMYLNTDLKPGPYLRTLLAHEYTHGVVFSEHIFGRYLPEVSPQDEEGWLNEALAHLVEDLHGYSWANLDYRVSAFLSAPERYSLVVPDYYSAGLWRSHGNRGATYLFLRWCMDQYGPDFLSRLIRTSLGGIQNLEVATQEPFAELFRRWSVAVALEGSNLAGQGKDLSNSLQRVDYHRPLAGRLLCGPHYQSVPLAQGDYSLQLAGTAIALVLLHSPAAERSRVTVVADQEADLQVSLVRLPAQTARLDLGHEAVKERPGSVRLVLTVHDANVTLDGAVWERLTPKANLPEDTSYRPEAAPASQAAAWFGNRCLQAGERRVSEPIPLPALGGGNNVLIFKVGATDAAGHHLAAWHEIVVSSSH